MRIKISDEEIIKAAESSESMLLASTKVGLNYKTFRVHAKRLGVFKPNQSGKGTSKPKVEGKGKTSLKEILEGKHPQFHTYELKNRLYKAGLKEPKCEECGIFEWNGKPISLELDHINGVRYDHRLENLKILCPNCHSQTPTFRSKNRKDINSNGL